MLRPPHSGEEISSGSLTFEKPSVVSFVDNTVDTESGVRLRSLARLSLHLMYFGARPRVIYCWSGVCEDNMLENVPRRRSRHPSLHKSFARPRFPQPLLPAEPFIDM